MGKEGRREAGEGEELIILALGGNLARGGDGVASTFDAALAALAGEGVRTQARSRVWRSAAWPDPAEPAFLNAVALVATALDPPALMARLHAVEATFGRVREGAARNAARPLDLDLIGYGRLVRASDPVLPHPRAAGRLFVMGPLAELAPAWRHPLLGVTAAELAARADVGRDAAPVL